MILVRSLILASALFVGSFSFANDIASDVAPMNDRYWQCQAHSVRSDWRVYTGEISNNRYDAQESALYTCESAEGHRCKPHRCRRVSYNRGTNY